MEHLIPDMHDVIQDIFNILQDTTVNNTTTLALSSQLFFNNFQCRELSDFWNFVQPQKFSY